MKKLKKMIKNHRRFPTSTVKGNAEKTLRDWFVVFFFIFFLFFMKSHLRKVS